MSETRYVAVLCDDGSHPGKRALVGRLRRHISGEFVAVVSGNELGDRGNLTRRRHTLRCPLCGLAVTLTEGMAGTLYDGLAATGAWEVTLASLARAVS